MIIPLITASRSRPRGLRRGGPEGRNVSKPGPSRSGKQTDPQVSRKSPGSFSRLRFAYLSLLWLSGLDRTAPRRKARRGGWERPPSAATLCVTRGGVSFPCSFPRQPAPRGGRSHRNYPCGKAARRAALDHGQRGGLFRCQQRLNRGASDHGSTLDASRPYSLVVGQDWELRGHPRSEMLDGQSRGHSWRLARIPRRVPDCGPGAVSGARASPRSAHFGDGTQGSAEHGLSSMVERVSLVAGLGRRGMRFASFHDRQPRPRVSSIAIQSVPTPRTASRHACAAPSSRNPSRVIPGEVRDERACGIAHDFHPPCQRQSNPTTTLQIPKPGNEDSPRPSMRS